MSTFEKEGKKVDETVNNLAKDADKSAKNAGSRAKSDVDNTAKAAKKVVDKVTGEEKTVLDKAEEQLEAAAEKLKNGAESLSKEVSKDAREFSDLAAKEAAVARKHFREASENIVEELRDPAVSTTVVFTALTASAATAYLAQQQKQGKFTWLLATGVAVGVAALSVAEYFSVRAYFNRSGSA